MTRLPDGSDASETEAGDAERHGVRYPPNRVRDRLHRALFGIAAALGPTLQDVALRRFFDRLYRRPDPWMYESTPYQELKGGRTLALIPRRTYRRVLEVGCGEGVFSRRLLEARQVHEFVGVDISERAVARARSRCAGYDSARFYAQNILRARLSGEFDLSILCEILYYLGDSVAELAELIMRGLSPGGIVVLVHPWPEAQRLHQRFLSGSGLRVVNEVVEGHVLRPFCVTILEHALAKAAPTAGS